MTYESFAMHGDLPVFVTTSSSSNYVEEIVDVSRYKRGNYNQNEIMSYERVQLCNIAGVRRE